MTTQSTAGQPQSLTRFWQPRYWPVWLGLAFLRLASFLPVRAQLALGRGLGRVAGLGHDGVVQRVGRVLDRRAYAGPIPRCGDLDVHRGSRRGHPAVPAERQRRALDVASAERLGDPRRGNELLRLSPGADEYGVIRSWR